MYPSLTSSPGPAAVSLLQNVLLKAFFGHRSQRIVVGTDVELEETLVVGGKLHAQHHHTAVFVLLDDHASPIRPAALISSRLCGGKKTSG